MSWTGPACKQDATLDKDGEGLEEGDGRGKRDGSSVGHRGG